MHVKVKFLEGFKDGTIFSRAFAANEEAVLTEEQLAQVSRSGGVFQVVENVIPNPLKAEAEERKQRREDMPDPLNSENSINKLDSHVADYEENLEDERKEELRRKVAPEVEKKSRKNK